MADNRGPGAADGAGSGVHDARGRDHAPPIRAPGLGFLLVCSADFAMAEDYGGEVELTLTQAIMQGASHCDSRHGRKADEKEGR